jgi:TolB protein
MLGRARITTVAALALAVALVSALAAQAHVATKPGKNGLIAFKRYGDSSRSTGAIYTIASNGTSVHQITTPSQGVVDDQPDWSPDGSLITFFRCPPDVSCEVFTVKPDGSDETQVTPGTGACPPVVATDCVDGADPTFLPDGAHIAYTQSTGAVKHFGGYDQIQHSDIVVRDLDGSNPRVLVRSRDYQGDLHGAIFSPDGTRFVYERANSPASKPAFGHALFVARADGSGQRQLTPWSLGGGDSPDWSPNGKLILFRSHEDEPRQSQIYVVRPDGNGLRALTHFKQGTTVLSYSFSPDGRWITFAKTGKNGQPDVFVMRADGTGMRPVTRTAVWDSAPDWGPAS